MSSSSGGGAQPQRYGDPSQQGQYPRQHPYQQTPHPPQSNSGFPSSGMQPQPSQQTSWNPHAKQVLQNGYEMQYYRDAGNPGQENIDRLIQQLQTMPDSTFQVWVVRAQEVEQRQTALRHRYRHDKGLFRLETGGNPMESFGAPKYPDKCELLATGDRAYAIQALEQYRRDWEAWTESMDPGDLGAEEELERMDRLYAEHKKKRKEKRKKSSCNVM